MPRLLPAGPGGQTIRFPAGPIAGTSWTVVEMIPGPGPGKLRARCVCGTVRIVKAAVIAAGRSRICRSCVSRGNAAKNTAAGHTGRLSQPVWPRLCKTCGGDFVGTARQQYCGPNCKPKAIRAAERKSNRVE